MKSLMYVFRLNQKWKMFRKPRTHDGWYVIYGTLVGGKIVDLFAGSNDKIKWEKPQRVALTYSSQRWRKYMMNIRRKKYKHHRLKYAEYLCAQWDRDHQGKAMELENVAIYFMLEKTIDHENSTPQKKLLLKHKCNKKKKIDSEMEGLRR